MALFDFLKEGLNYEQFIKSKMEEESLVASVLKNKFGLNTSNPDAVIDLIKRKRLEKAYIEGNLIGITCNNRWLYTINGLTIGKQGKRFMVENIGNRTII